MASRDELEAAAKRVNALTSAPSTSDMLQLYALYKQATVGDATGSRPGIFDVKGRAKWDAWAEKKGTPADVAADQYVALARRLGA
jgi:acyl-CoA-binding protein